jgi:hypothetical protein
MLTHASCFARHPLVSKHSVKDILTFFFLFEEGNLALACLCIEVVHTAFIAKIFSHTILCCLSNNSVAFYEKAGHEIAFYLKNINNSAINK